MQKNSTPTQSATISTGDKFSQQARPRRSTIEFLKQFARAYHFESKAPASLGNIVMN